MEENINRYPEEQYDEIDLMELFRKLIKNWKVLLRWTVIAGCAGFIIAISLVKSYTVNASLAPETTSRSSSGSLSSLASLAGINLNTATSNALYPELYPQIVSSIPFTIDLFSAPVEFKDKKEGMVTTDFYTYLKEYTKAPWWTYIMSAPMKGLSWLIGTIKGKEEKIEGYENLNPAALTKEQDKIKKVMNKSIVLTIDKKTSLISLGVTAQNPAVAYQMTEFIMDKLKAYVTDYHTQKSRNDVEYYNTLFEEAKADYFTSQQAYARYVDANQGVVLQRVRIEQERLQNEMNLKYQLYNSCAQQLQVAKAKLQQDTPVYLIVAPPTQPLQSSSMSRFTTLVVITFLGFCLACLWVLFLKDKISELKTTVN